MKMLGEIIVGPYKFTPWKWSNQKGAYVREVGRNDMRPITQEEFQTLLKMGGINPFMPHEYGSLEKFDELVVELSERLEKMKAFQ